MKYWKFILKIFILFFIGSIFGCVVETIYAIIKTGGFQVRQGLIYGPFIPIYGLGTILFYLILLATKKPLNVFFICIIMGGLLEILCSIVQENVFGTISSDYSNTFLNIYGRTNLQYSIYWGLIGLLFFRLFPLVDKIDLIIENKKWRIITYILILFILIDIVVSSLACLRQFERYKGIEAKKYIDVFLDVHYPDEFLKKIYTNSMWVK